MFVLDSGAPRHLQQKSATACVTASVQTAVEEESYFRRIQRLRPVGKISGLNALEVGAPPLSTLLQKPHEEFCAGHDHFVPPIGSVAGDDSG